MFRVQEASARYAYTTEQWRLGLSGSGSAADDSVGVECQQGELVGHKCETMVFPLPSVMKSIFYPVLGVMG